jgi:MFS superfamily sulfate permease-like transporter
LDTILIRSGKCPSGNPTDTHLGAAAIGVVSLLILGAWNFVKDPRLKLIPAPLLAIVVGSLLAIGLRRYDNAWSIEPWHFFRVPTPDPDKGFLPLLTFPSLEQFRNPAIYFAALLIAVVASLETILNLDAVDRSDPERRHSPPSRELVAQGVGNTLAGLLGGLPITSRVVYGSVNIEAGGRTYRATVMHGLLFLLCATFLPSYLNLIPLSCIAAILFWTGAKMASPHLFQAMWAEGRHQFIPFLVTMFAIVFTEELIGALIGLVVGVGFILNSNLRRPIKKVVEKHIGGELIRIELGNQVSFLNRGRLERALREVQPGSHLMLDATQTDYIDPDILSLIRDYKERTAPNYNIEVSLRGFKNKYSILDETRFIDYSTRELQQDLKPREVLQILQEGNQRFKSGAPLFRDFASQLSTASQGQFPFAAVLSCIDSRAPVETILDLGLGDIFSIRIAGNVVGPKVLGSLEYSCGVAGSKLIVVLGHTKCGAVTASVKFASTDVRPEAATGCQHLNAIVDRITQSIDLAECKSQENTSDAGQPPFIERVTRANVLHSIRQIVDESPILKELSDQGKIGLIGAIYDVGSGNIDFLVQDAIGLDQAMSDVR